MTSSALSELSILIVTWNGDELLRNCLDSLRRACGDRPEIVVVDNADLDSTKALVAAHPNAKYIAAPENLGFAGGNNLGLPLCTRPYILLLNNDTIVHEEPFSQLIQYLKDHPKVAVVQGKMNMPLRGDVLDSCGIMLTRAGILLDRFIFKPSATTSTPTQKVYAAKGACLLFRRAILDPLDGVLFYDHFKSNHEETDFCHRVWLTGNEVHFVDTPAIDHLCGRTVRKLDNTDFSAQNLSNQLFSYLSLFEKKTLVVLLTKFLAIHGIIALRFAVVGDFKPFKVLLLAFRRTYARRAEIARVRAKAQASRALTDRALFTHVMANITPRFYWHWARGDVQSHTARNAIASAETDT